MKEFDKKGSPSREGMSKFLPASMSDASSRRRLTEYEIQVQGNDYRVFLTNTQTGTRQQTTFFQNTDGARGQSLGFVGVQAYAGNVVAWRHIRIKP